MEEHRRRRHGAMRRTSLCHSRDFPAPEFRVIQASCIPSNSNFASRGKHMFPRILRDLEKGGTSGRPSPKAPSLPPSSSSPAGWSYRPFAARPSPTPIFETMCLYFRCSARLVTAPRHRSLRRRVGRGSPEPQRLVALGVVLRCSRGVGQIVGSRRARSEA